MVDITLRAAEEADAVPIRHLIYQVGINPTGLDWRRFIVAQDSSRKLVGCGQLKPHGQGIVEMASLAVVPEYQGQGIGSAMIKYLLKVGPRPLYLMCRSGLGPIYEKYGFQTLTPEEMPRYFRRMTQLTGLVSALSRREETLLIMKLQ